MNISKTGILKIGIHLLMWAVLIAFPYFLVPDRVKADISVGHILLPVAEYMIIFYLNYFLLVDKFIIQRRRYLLFSVINISIVLLFRFDGYIIHMLNGDSLVKKELHDNLFNRKEGGDFNLKNIIVLFVPAFFSIGVRMIERWSKLETEKKNIENRNLQSELQNLKYQLQPHFFFNSLNNIYSLVDISPAKAQETIHALSKLMQYLLHDTNHEKVDVAVEINYLKQYIRLMEIRQGEDIITNCLFADVKPGQYSIAPLLLIPIIENAYKHGVSATNRSQINFEISVTNNTLLFISTNSNYPKNQSDISGSGIGLDNLKKRLKLIYPGKHTLIAEIKESMFCLALTIDLENFTKPNNE